MPSWIRLVINNMKLITLIRFFKVENCVNYLPNIENILLEYYYHIPFNYFCKNIFLYEFDKKYFSLIQRRHISLKLVFYIHIQVTYFGQHLNYSRDFLNKKWEILVSSHTLDIFPHIMARNAPVIYMQHIGSIISEIWKERIYEMSLRKKNHAVFLEENIFF